MSSLVEILIFLPIVGAIIGYVCKLMAIKMLFHPAKWIGIGPLGWQGVVQRRSPKFAGGVADTVMGAGVRVDTMLAKVDAASIAATLGPLLEAAAPGALEAAIEAVKPGAYAALPAPVKAQLAGQVGASGTRITKVLIEELRPLVPELVDVRQLIIRQLSGENADKLARLFQEVGKRELQVVIWYGAVLGFIIGLVEVGFYAALERWWLLPMIGAIDGLVNNWLAIQMIFRPLEKKRYLGIFPFQGLFPARQDEISRDYGRMLASEVLTPRDFLAHVDPASRARLEAAAKVIVEREAAPLMQMMAMMLGAPLDQAAKDRALAAVTGSVATVLPAHAPAIEAEISRQLAVAETLEAALTVMPKAEFEAVLRGVFEEDEWILVTLGGVLGGAIGTLQGAIVLALQ